MRKPYGFAFGGLLVASVVFLSAQVGGFPSRPRFQAVGVGTSAPAGSGEMSLQKNANTSQTLGVDNDSNGTANLSRLAVSSGDANLAVYVTGSGRTTAAITNGPTGAQAGLRTLGAHPIVFGTNNTLAATISSGQVFDFVNTPTVNGSSIGPLLAVKTANTATASDATLNDDPHLSVTIAANVRYAVEGALHVNSASATPGIQLACNGPGIHVPTISFDLSRSDSTVANDVSTVCGAVSFALPAAGATIIHVNGLTSSDTAGTFVLRWAQGVSNATATTMFAGSWMRLTPLN